MSSSGYKRTRHDDDRSRRSEVDGGLPYDGGSESYSSRPSSSKRPRDWREAFLDDDDVDRVVSSSKDRGDSRQSRHREDKYREESHREERRRDDRDVGDRHRAYRRDDRERRPSRDAQRTEKSDHGSTRQQDRSSNGEQGRGQPRVTAASSVPSAASTAVPDDISKPNVNPDDTPAPEEPEDEEARAEARRKRRKELMERLAGTQSGINSGAPSSVGGGVASVNGESRPDSIAAGLTGSAARLALDTPASPRTREASFDISTSDLAGKQDVIPAETRASVMDGEQQISAADYDPEEDRKALQQQHQEAVIPPQEVADGVGEPAPASAPAAMTTNEDDEWEEVEVDDEDEEFDMFAVDAPRKKKITRRRKEAATDEAPKAVQKAAVPVVDVSTLLDNYDDSEGYYRITPGELLDNGHYQVTVTLGKGMFSAVYRAKIAKKVEPEDVIGREVAIKVIRSQESMYVAGRKEATILQKLMAADPDDKKHIIRLLQTFEHRGHLCLVTESMSMNLRDVVKRFGKDIGLNLRAVRAYAHQMFLALSLMKKCNIIHADLKPDNILVTESKAVLKVADLGSACDISEAEITPYLVSRFYRAPEIILGLPYNEALDIWSIGCTLYELYTGKILFPGRSNNQMLHLMMDLKGKFTHRMIKKAHFGAQHFDESMNFISVHQDKITGRDVIKTLVISRPTRELKSRLLPSTAVQNKMPEDDLKLLINFVDLLDKALALDPDKRMTAKEALVHPFLAAS